MVVGEGSSEFIHLSSSGSINKDKHILDKSIGSLMGKKEITVREFLDVYKEKGVFRLAARIKLLILGKGWLTENKPFDCIRTNLKDEVRGYQTLLEENRVTSEKPKKLESEILAVKKLWQFLNLTGEEGVKHITKDPKVSHQTPLGNKEQPIYDED